MKEPNANMLEDVIENQYVASMLSSYKNNDLMRVSSAIFVYGAKQFLEKHKDLVGDLSALERIAYGPFENTKDKHNIEKTKTMLSKFFYGLRAANELEAKIFSSVGNPKKGFKENAPNKTTNQNEAILRKYTLTRHLAKQANKTLDSDEKIIKCTELEKHIMKQNHSVLNLKQNEKDASCVSSVPNEHDKTHSNIKVIEDSKKSLKHYRKSHKNHGNKQKKIDLSKTKSREQKQDALLTSRYTQNINSQIKNSANFYKIQGINYNGSVECLKQTKNHEHQFSTQDNDRGMITVADKYLNNTIINHFTKDRSAKTALINDNKSDNKKINMINHFLCVEDKHHKLATNNIKPLRGSSKIKDANDQKKSTPEFGLNGTSNINDIKTARVLGCNDYIA